MADDRYLSSGELEELEQELPTLRKRSGRNRSNWQICLRGRP